MGVGDEWAELIGAAKAERVERQALDTLRQLVEQAPRARRAYRRFHWGRNPRRARTAAAPLVWPGEVLTRLGDLAELGYLARKGKDPTYLYEHPFSSPLPELASTVDGQLVIVGGGYRITGRGIVG